MIIKALPMSPYWSLITSHDLLTLSVIKNLPRLERQYNLSLQT